MSVSFLYHFIVIISNDSAIDFGSTNDNRFYSSTNAKFSKPSSSDFSSSEFQSPSKIVNEYLNKDRKC